MLVAILAWLRAGLWLPLLLAVRLSSFILLGLGRKFALESVDLFVEVINFVVIGRSCGTRG